MSKEKTYKVKEAFLTVQGEGVHAGTPAVFIRFTGCNFWNGKAEDKARISAIIGVHQCFPEQKRKFAWGRSRPCG